MEVVSGFVHIVHVVHLTNEAFDKGLTKNTEVKYVTFVARSGPTAVGAHQCQRSLTVPHRWHAEAPTAGAGLLLQGPQLRGLLACHLHPRPCLPAHSSMSAPVTLPLPAVQQKGMQGLA